MRCIDNIPEQNIPRLVIMSRNFHQNAGKGIGTVATPTRARKRCWGSFQWCWSRSWKETRKEVEKHMMWGRRPGLGKDPKNELEKESCSSISELYP